MKKNDVVQVSIRFDSEIKQKLAYIAEYEGRSVNGQVIYLVRRDIKRFESRCGEIGIKNEVIKSFEDRSAGEEIF